MISTFATGIIRVRKGRSLRGIAGDAAKNEKLVSTVIDDVREGGTALQLLAGAIVGFLERYTAPKDKEGRTSVACAIGYIKCLLKVFGIDGLDVGYGKTISRYLDEKAAAYGMCDGSVEQEKFVWHESRSGVKRKAEEATGAEHRLPSFASGAGALPASSSTTAPGPPASQRARQGGDGDIYEWVFGEQQRLSAPMPEVPVPSGGAPLQEGVSQPRGGEWGLSIHNIDWDEGGELLQQSPLPLISSRVAVEVGQGVEAAGTGPSSSSTTSSVSRPINAGVEAAAVEGGQSRGLSAEEPQRESGGGVAPVQKESDEERLRRETRGAAERMMNGEGTEEDRAKIAEVFGERSNAMYLIQKYAETKRALDGILREYIEEENRAIFSKINGGGSSTEAGQGVGGAPQNTVDVEREKEQEEERLRSPHPLANTQYGVASTPPFESGEPPSDDVSLEALFALAREGEYSAENAPED